MDVDRMRAALAKCTFLPGSSHKRFARSLAAMDLAKITEKQKRHLIRLAWRYRRQMPWDLVPSKDAVEALDAGWLAQDVAGMTIMTTAAPPARPERKIKPVPHLPALSLFPD